ncbi:NADH-quinone oxidoreductase subunit N [Streptomyces sp. AJS327]|uniref:NADH-quinone oxidoreductase subunit N n=1 Tax=Streptomyces sp. AJS327 TaxID=2545265 RepID=UPI0015DE46F5|nr:proton-conducting transporter membrane subunit [Streptomyces sp. AJS327]MBA0054043.1 NADH-quinone oxidoreductase subunit N [Streptomyces sp. AJS327]
MSALLATAAATPSAPPGDLSAAPAVVQSVDWVAIAPPTLAAVFAIAVLVVDLFVAERRKRLLDWLALSGLTLAGLTLLPLVGADRRTFCLTRDPDACSYVADPFTLTVQLLVFGGALVCALLATRNGPTTAPGPGGGAGPDAAPDASARSVRGEFWFLLLCSVAGAALLPAARDLATLVVALEVVSLPAFALVGLRGDTRRSGEAALKFFLSSVTATAVTLLGVSFVYAASGSTHLTVLAEKLPGPGEGELGTLAATGVLLTLVGFAFKTAAVPFHFWVPETYAGAPLPVAAYLSVVGKAAGFSGVLLVTVLAFPAHREVWGPALAVLAALTMSAGNLAALRQRADREHGAVRLLAWSSIGQAGYLLVPLAAAGYAGEPREAVGPTLAYALMYAVVNLGAFAVAALVGRAGRRNRLADYRGMARGRPLPALALAFFLLCLAGLPPGIIGLFAKVTVFRSAVDAGLGWLAVVMAVNVVLALYYYLRWTAELFRAEPGTTTETGDPVERPRTTAPAHPATPTSPATSGHPAGAATPAEDAPSAARTVTDPPPATEAADPSRVPDGHRTPLGGTPAPLAVAITLTLLLSLALSAAPQLILRFATLPLF